jgi:alpha-L-glutamate ligase-like protein
MFATVSQLQRAGVMGMNYRNIACLFEHNPRHRYPLVDDKLRTKDLASDAGIPVPPLYGVIEIQRQVSHIKRTLAPLKSFVIKPARGSGGNGILVISGQLHGFYRRAHGGMLTDHDLQHYLSRILSGMYSLGAQPDRAMIEYLVNFDPVFSSITYQGVPDVRIVVYRGVPVMAMVRLPTWRSRGRANLHQGAIGAGVDIATGVTREAVLANRIVAEHPDTGVAIAGIHVPYWDLLLQTAARCYELTGMGYLGADFVLDKAKGALLLELNARPGLNIQIANRSGLIPRLKLVDSYVATPCSLTERVGFAKHEFRGS